MVGNKMGGGGGGGEVGKRLIDPVVVSPQYTW